MKSILKRVVMIGICLAIIVVLVPNETAHATTITLGDYYYLQSALDSNMVVDVSGGSRSDGANIQLWEKNGSDAQLFRIARNGDGYYALINKGSNKAIDIAGGNTNSGTNIQQWSQNNTMAQQWKIYNAPGFPDGYVIFRNVCGKYIDVNGAGTQNGTNIQLWSGNGTKAQVFKLVPYVQVSYVTISLGDFNSIDEWVYRLDSAEIAARGIDAVAVFGSDFYSMSSHKKEGYYSDTPIIVGRDILEYRTIPVTYTILGQNITEYIKLPSRIRFKLHKHEYHQFVWFDFTYLTFSESCSCGVHSIYQWEVPYPIEDNVT